MNDKIGGFGLCSMFRRAFRSKYDRVFRFLILISLVIYIVSGRLDLMFDIWELFYVC